jgi:hypothetical protein
VRPKTRNQFQANPNALEDLFSAFGKVPTLHLRMLLCPSIMRGEALSRWESTLSKRDIHRPGCLARRWYPRLCIISVKCLGHLPRQVRADCHDRRQIWHIFCPTEPASDILVRMYVSGNQPPPTYHATIKFTVRDQEGRDRNACMAREPISSWCYVGWQRR